MVDQIEKKLEDLVVSRKLASVQIISSITPLGTELEIAKVLGWQVVIRKGEFKQGEKVLYFEIDSKLPEWFTDMEMTDYRAKTVLIEGVLSQGLIKSVTYLKEHEKYNVGDDVSEVLDVMKYDDEGVLLSVQENQEFPIHLIPKTDEPRIQSEPRYLEVFKGKPYFACLKYDGTSSSFMLDQETKNDLWVCSRNKLIPASKKDNYWQIAEKYKLLDKLKKHPDLAIQGEIYGTGIQKNPFEIKEKRLAVFTIYSLTQRRCLDYDEMSEVCKGLELPVVEVIEKGDNFDYDIDRLLENTKGFYGNTKNPREGLVFRLQKYWDSPTCRASFKVINNDYLIKAGKK